nr:MAG TPA: endodeoxyribonuclease I [Caudoviricetes sp.]
MKINEVTYKWNGALTKRRSTTRIILHHAAASRCTAQQIHSWHLANGWVGIGYHFFVRKDGSVYRGRPEDTVGAHAGNNNYDSIGICFEGNFMTETMPVVQKRAGQELVQYLKDKYGISKVQKHSDVNATGCPGTRFPFKEISEGAAAGKPAESTAEGFTAVFPQLSKGDKGDKVRVLQELLRGKGYDLGAYGADGDFGGATRGAVMAFQVRNHLSADGIVGKNTWRKLLRE